MKTIINNLKKYMLISFVFISAGTMAADNGGYPLAPELNHIELPSVFVDILAGNPTETALEMEEWMYDASYWKYTWIAEADESEILIEEWMVDVSYWNYSWIAEADDSEIVIDNWMADASYWNNSWIAEASETDVAIEEWMADPARWRFSRMHDCAHINQTAVPEKKMRINDWMKDPERWTTGS